MSLTQVASLKHHIKQNVIDWNKDYVYGAQKDSVPSSGYPEGGGCKGIAKSANASALSARLTFQKRKLPPRRPGAANEDAEKSPRCES